MCGVRGAADRCLGLSYHSREITEPLYNTATPEGRQRYELLLAHGGDEKHIPVDWERLDCLGYSYVAFGHIHKPQAVRRNRILYAGAPEPTDRNDTGPHGYVKGEITEKAFMSGGSPALPENTSMQRFLWTKMIPQAA